MSNEFIDSLLADIPAEEVVDKRIGTYSDAVLKTEVEVQANEWEGKFIYSLTAKFDIVDQDGNPAIVQQGIGIPDSEAPGWAKQALLQWLHAFELVDPTSKNTPIIPANGDEDTKRGFVEKIAAAFNTRVGATVPVVVYMSKKGFVNVRAGKPVKK